MSVELHILSYRKQMSLNRGLKFHKRNFFFSFIWIILSLHSETLRKILVFESNALESIIIRWIKCLSVPHNLVKYKEKLLSLCIYFYYVGSSLFHAGFLSLWQLEATFHCSAKTSHWYSFSYWRTQILGMPASVVEVHGLVIPQHVKSSQTRDQTCVPCIGRKILIPLTSKYVWGYLFLTSFSLPSEGYMIPLLSIWDFQTLIFQSSRQW